MNQRNSNLSNSQLMIWTGQQLEPRSPLYNMVLCFHIDAILSHAHFQQAFSAMIAASDAMRTVIDVIDGVPMQRVQAHMDYQVEVVDFSDETHPKRAMSQWVEIHNCQQFDLSRCSFESTLLLTGGDKCMWYLNQHHVTTDAWSTALIYRYVANFYTTAVQGKLDTRVKFPAWSEYLRYEKNSVRDKATLKALDFWQRQAKQQVDPVCFYSRKLPYKHAVTKRVPCALGTSRTRRLKALAKTSGFRSLNLNLTLFNFFLLILSAWLYRVSGSQKMAIGAPAHNRSSQSFRETIGLFIELFPILIEHQDKQTFRELFTTVTRQSQSWLRYAQPGTSNTAGARQFNVVLNYIHATFEPFSGIPVEAEWRHTGYGDPRHDLRLQVHDFGDTGNFLLYFDFNMDTFPEVTQQHAIKHFLAVIDAFLDDPDRRIDHIALSTQQERQLYLHDYNQTSIAARPTVTVLDLFAKQCKKTPHAAAVTDSEHQISYAELDRRSGQLADTLQKKGSTKNSLIGIHLKRSIEMLVAIFGVLKAGASYVPIESKLPVNRITYILQDTGMKLVLTQSSLVGQLDPFDVELICVDQLPTEDIDDTQQNHIATGSDFAYVIYTSGSTGFPKGVIIDHQGLHEYICWARDAFIDNKPMNFALYSGIGFDLTVTSLFVPLTCGGSIVVFPEKDATGDLSVISAFEDNRVDIIKLTPAHLRLVLDMDISNSHVSHLILGGEDLKTELCDRARSLFQRDLVIFNEYGPTEAVVGCMIHQYNPLSDTESSVPIGQPAANTSIYILDTGMNPVPPGVIGEIYINRQGLARGYLGRDDLTAERFLDDPFKPGQRIYKTGDLARFRNDAIIEYLGRSDEQVKIRGTRIELAEVEHKLLEHPDVNQCVLQIVQPDIVSNHNAASYCNRCGLASTYPGVSFDSMGICNTCIEFDTYKSRAQQYFKTMDDLQIIFDQLRQQRSGDYDCLALLSGGKDSTYALARIVGMGVKVLAFTLDNGFISQTAKDNIQRVTKSLGVDHIYGHTKYMNAIFVDSLERHSNVCQGCFKVIYTLSMQIAARKNIPCIVTGLSRGQFFETRLTADLFQENDFNTADIDQMVLDARKAYHRVDDAVSQLMDVSLLEQDQIFSEIRFVDFYRYCDADLTEMLSFLDKKLPWVRPKDTGRSTNCLINDTGIYVHKRKENFHNYALPYSWDVRLDVKQRDEALDELNDDIDVRDVYRNLNSIGYLEEKFFADPDEKKLAAYFTSDTALTVTELKRWLAEHLPNAMIPAYMVQLDSIPLTENGKVNRVALPDPKEQRPQLEQKYTGPSTETEKILVQIWESTLDIHYVGIHDNYFDLGGDSISAIQIVSQAKNAGFKLKPNDLFQHQTVAELAAIARKTGINRGGCAAMTAGAVPLTPIQRWFFAQNPSEPDFFSQSVLLSISDEVDVQHIANAIKKLIEWHDGLRLCFTQHNNRWVQELDIQPAAVDLQTFIAPSAVDEYKSLVRETELTLNQSLSLKTGKLVAAALLEPIDSNVATSPSRQLMLVIHHLVIDAVSWLILLEDLDTLCKQLAADRNMLLPARTSSCRTWAETLQSEKDSAVTAAEHTFWSAMKNTQPDLLPHKDMLEKTRCFQHVTLAVDEVKHLTNVGLTKWQMPLHEVLLAALAMTIAKCTGKTDITINIESHGRESIDSQIDTTRTVGWFTSLFPLLLTVSHPDSISKHMQQLKKRLNEVPRNGVGYGILNYDDEITATSMPPWGGVLLNFMGRTRSLLKQQSWFQFSRPLSVSRSPHSRMCFTWEINAWLDDNGLQIELSYSDVKNQPEEIIQMAELLAENLRLMSTFSDDTSSRSNRFLAQKLDQSQLDKLAGLLNGK